MTMVAEPSVDVAAEDRADRAESGRALIMVSEEKRCPRCQSLIPPECVNARSKTEPHVVGPYVRTVLIYCPPCRAGFEADFETHNGFPAQVSPTRVVIDSDPLRDLKRARATVRGDVFVERVALTMEAEHELEAAKEQEAARRAMARSIRRTEVSLERLRQTYALRYPGRPYTPEEAAGIDQGDTDCDLATGRLDEFRQVQDTCGEHHSPYIPDGATATVTGLGGVPAPERPARTIDTSTSQVVAAPGGGDDGPVDTWDRDRQDPEHWDGLS
jgi:hypothetical protein